ncbi:MAG TPA: DegT/DnrJ/EryC1/StrS family aminotransferase [Blastocatellia bacterium]|nr:DegT/DnrJ/EryC1/StrS family aminotransferase [Blastocatellia bacterium]
MQAQLAAGGIETLIHYPFLLHQQPLFQRREQPALPAAERVAGGILSLPFYPQLCPEEARKVVEVILEAAPRP